MIGEPDGHDGTQDSSGNGIVLATITALLVAALLVIVVTTVAGGDHPNAPAKPARVATVEPSPAESALTRNLHTSPAAARESGPASVAAVYGDPLGCLRVTIARADPSYARVVYNRVSACGRNDGTITAIYHRVDATGVVLDAKG